MKNIHRIFVAMRSIAIIALVAVIGFSMAACGDGGDTPTVTLTPASVTINDDSLTATVTVGGTATGTVTLNTSALPSGVTATVDGETITVTGVLPTAENGSINNSYTVAVTREGVTQNLTVVVNLTTTFNPNAPITLTPASVTINDGNLTATVTVGGTATGAVTLGTSALPEGVTATVDGETITVTGARPTAEGASLSGSYTVGVTRDSETLDFTVNVNLTTTFDPDAPTVILTPASVTINDTTLTATSEVSGTATGAVTLTTTALPSGVTAEVSGETITVTGERPITGTINNSYTVGVTREGVTEDLTVVVDLTTAPTVTLDPASVTIDDENLTATVTVSGTATGYVTLDISDLPEGVTAEVDGETITVTGVRPAMEDDPIDDSYTISVTREGVMETLTVVVDLTNDPCANGHNIVWVTDYTSIEDNKCEICGHIAGIGDIGPGGGVIFYVRSDAFTVRMVNTADNYTAHYLEAAPTDANGDGGGTSFPQIMRWRVGTTSDRIPNMEDFFLYAGTNVPPNEEEMTGINNDIGMGRQNTARIVAFYSTHEDQTSLNAARAVGKYTTETTEEGDWFLPSIGELHWLYQNRSHLDGKEGIDSVTPNQYWSSTQYNNASAWRYYFSNGERGATQKQSTHRVRPVRAF